jgi:hypothetical protein
MGGAEAAGPVIVMVEADDRENIQKWFHDSRFNVFDAVNIFDALEAVSDFTVREHPDVVLLNVECCDDDLPLIRSAYEAVSQSSPEVMAVKNAGRAKSSFYQGDLAHVAARLDSMIPNRTQPLN